MLYLHCGWLKTGTSSLQDVLYRHREELAAAGVVYPERWMSPTGSNHHGIAEMLSADRASSAGFGEFTRFLASQTEAGRDVVVSVEELTNWLLDDERVEVFRRFLAAARRVAPVRCIWTLRRLDEALGSLYRWHAMLGARLPPPDRFFEGFDRFRDLFSGMRVLAEEPLDGISYIRYATSGLHQEEVLRNLRLPDSLLAVLLVELTDTPRLNVALSHKQAVAMLCADSLAEQTGMRLDTVSMRKLFAEEGFEFEQDGRWQLVGGDVADALHARALAESARHGFPTYAAFFSCETVPDARPSPIAPDVLDDEDLRRLVERLRAHARS